MGDGTECSAGYSESHQDINQEDESENAIIGLKGCLKQLKSPLQVNCFNIKCFAVRYKCSLLRNIYLICIH